MQHINVGPLIKVARHKKVSKKENTGSLASFTKVCARYIWPNVQNAFEKKNLQKLFFAKCNLRGLANNVRLCEARVANVYNAIMLKLNLCGTGLLMWRKGIEEKTLHNISKYCSVLFSSYEHRQAESS